MQKQRDYSDKSKEAKDRRKRIVGKMRRQHIHPGNSPDEDDDPKPDRSGDDHEGTAPTA